MGGTQRLQPDVGKDEIFFAQLFLQLDHFLSGIGGGGGRGRTLRPYRIVFALALALDFGDFGVARKSFRERTSQLWIFFFVRLIYTEFCITDIMIFTHPFFFFFSFLSKLQADERLETLSEEG